jgi:antitoxin YqcF
MDSTQNQKPSCDTKAIARHAIGAFGSPPSVWRFGLDSEKLSIDVGGCGDRPYPGVVSYTTIGLSDWPPGATGLPVPGADPGSTGNHVTPYGTAELPLRFELAAACSADKKLFPNILATAAFSIMREGRLVHVGDVIREAVREVYPRSTIPHLYLTQPLLWPGRLTELQFAAKKVGWLLAVPASDGEIDFLHRQGDASIASLYKDRTIDMFDLDRTSWVG